MASTSENDKKDILPFEDHTPPRILLLCPDKALAPLSAADAWFVFKEAGCVVEFATENGDVPKGDQRILERSAFRKLAGATIEDVEKFYTMAGSDEFLNPRAWSASDFSLLAYDAVYLTTGFDTRLRQFLESESLHRLMATYFPLTKRRRVLQRAPTALDKLKRRSTTIPDLELPKTIDDKQRDELINLEGPRKVVGAVGKGVLVLSKSMVVDNLTEEERKSVEEECATRVEAVSEARKAEAEKIIKRQSLRRSATTGSIFGSSRRRKEQKAGVEDTAKCGHLTTPALRSVLYGVETTTEPTWLEHVGTRLSTIYGLKGMFRTYKMSTQDQILSVIGNPSLYHAGPPNLKPFTHAAPTHHYISSRHPFDSQATATNVLEEIATARREWEKSRVV